MSPSYEYDTIYLTTSMRKQLEQYTKKETINHFCFCLGLRTGTILSSVWWLISGLAFSIYLFYTLNDQTPHTIVKPLALISAAESAIVFVVALFGLNALVNRNTIPAISLYVRLAWTFMVFLWSALRIANFIVFLSYKSQYEETCPSNCEQGWKHGIIGLVFEMALTSVFNIYFVMILQIYLRRREARLKLYQKHQEKRKSRGSIASSTNLSWSRPGSVASFSVASDFTSRHIRLQPQLKPRQPQLQPPLQPPSRPLSQPISRPLSQPISRPTTLQGVYRPRSMYMSSYNPNNIVINQRTLSSYFQETDSESESVPSVEGDTTSIGYYDNSSVASSYNNIDQKHPSDEQQQYNEEMPEHEHDLLGTMDITDYKNSI